MLEIFKHTDGGGDELLVNRVRPPSRVQNALYFRIESDGDNLAVRLGNTQVRELRDALNAYLLDTADAFDRFLRGEHVADGVSQQWGTDACSCGHERYRHRTGPCFACDCNGFKDVARGPVNGPSDDECACTRTTSRLLAVCAQCEHAPHAAGACRHGRTS